MHNKYRWWAKSFLSRLSFWESEITLFLLKEKKFMFIENNLRKNNGRLAAISPTAYSLIVQLVARNVKDVLAHGILG